MQKRQLGNSDLHLTVVGLGTWAIGGPWRFGWGKQDDENSIRAIQASLDTGVNWIDTAHVYGFGHSEKIVGQAVKGRREDVILATKCGLLQGEGDEPVNNLKADSVRKEIEGSLKRLDVDVIDLYQIHWPNPDEQIEEAWEEIQKAIQEGKIRCAGVSNFSVSQMERVHKIAPVTSLQPPYSMLRRSIEDSQMPWCHQHKVGIVAYSPMLSGMLTGKVTKEYAANLDESDWRRRSPEWQGEKLEANIDFVENTLRPIAEEHGVEPAQIAVAWTLRDNKITSAIVGARNREQAESNARAAEITLSPEQLNRIEEGLKQRASRVEGANA